MCRTPEHAIDIIYMNVWGTLFVFQLLLLHRLDQQKKLELLNHPYKLLPLLLLPQMPLPLLPVLLAVLLVLILVLPYMLVMLLDL